ncbi:MAG TPA: ABC transporter substrate-binding protein, partial [Smithellaceae bacterium]|nr:ABC transporter substrate-binding protein [Smithellaceae bacterium]
MMKQSRRFNIVVFTALMLLIAVAISLPSISNAEPKGEPFVIGYIGMVASPGTRPCMDIQKMAVEEINAAGGIMGRPVKYVAMDNKGDTSLSVEAFRKLVMEDKAKFISVEGRTEICLAVQEASGQLAKQYPHILVFNGPMGAELTARIIDQA